MVDSSDSSSPMPVERSDDVLLGSALRALQADGGSDGCASNLLPKIGALNQISPPRSSVDFSFSPVVLLRKRPKRLLSMLACRNGTCGDRSLVTDVDLLCHGTQLGSRCPLPVSIL
ncbi:hypothetical protein MRB53_028175 [Persea americana]|uniref:Uncharacterized protein n=1 Tax=Persea americana TaxID=3435 RepID=A0ACC2KEV6_PERAE|nr:hypothetical protein MRB53_028175 [Persea americana]